MADSETDWDCVTLPLDQVIHADQESWRCSLCNLMQSGHANLKEAHRAALTHLLTEHDLRDSTVSALWVRSGRIQGAITGGPL